MATTLRDIATHLSVSQTVVSCVLNDKPGAWASPQTRQRIVDAARELNYRPSASARELATGRTMRLAIPTADASWLNGSSSRLGEMRGLLDAAAAHDYHVLLLHADSTRPDAAQLQRWTHPKICDGLGVFAEQVTPTLLSCLQAEAMPFVVIGNPGVAEPPQVDQDNRQYVFSSVAWLREQDMKRVALLIPPQPRQSEPAHIGIVRRAHRDALKKLCGGFDPILAPDEPLRDGEAKREYLRRAAPDAIITRGLMATLQWKAVLRLGAKTGCGPVLLAHLNTGEAKQLGQHADLENIAYHAHDPRAAGFKAGEVLIGLINGAAAPAKPIRIAVAAPAWYLDSPLT